MALALILAGEIVFAFLVVRIGWWIWRSRGQISVLFRIRPGPGPGPGVPLAAPDRPRLERSEPQEDLRLAA